VFSFGALTQVSSRLGALGIATNNPRAWKGEAQISSDQINRFSAGAAIRKILCPPASCVGRITQPGREFAFWRYSRALGGEGCAKKPGQAPLASCASTLPADDLLRMGYHNHRKAPHSRCTFPANPDGDFNAITTRESIP